MKKREKFVRRLVEQEANDIIGGWENAVSDGHEEKMPTIEALEKEIYDTAIHSNRVEINEALYAVETDIRFLGKERIKQIIKEAVVKLS